MMIGLPSADCEPEDGMNVHVLFTNCLASFQIKSRPRYSIYLSLFAGSIRWPFFLCET